MARAKLIRAKPGKLESVDTSALDAAARILGTAREALGRKERETASALMGEADRLLEAAWDVPTPWTRYRPW